MKFVLSCGLAALCLLHSTLHAQSKLSGHSDADSEETYVREAYAKLDYATQLAVVSDAATAAQTTLEPHRSFALTEAMNAGQVTFSLSNFKAGAISEIEDKPWGTLVTPESQVSAVLDSHVNLRSWKDGTAPAVQWRVGVAKWKEPRRFEGNEQYQAVLNMPLGKFLALGGKTLTYPDVVYEQYVSFTVTTTFQGRTVGPYKAMFLFGRNSKGELIAAPEDMVNQGSALFDAANYSLYPAGLLQTSLRSADVVKGWFRQTALSGNACAVGQAKLCCVGTRCGVSDYDLQQELSSPISPRTR
jgi:hypothetical protein